MHEYLVAAASAPSIHNTQPWLFRLRGETVEVLADRRRQLSVVDPDGREMFVSVGAAVFNLRLAATAHGRPVRVRLTPDRAEPDLAARLTLLPPARKPPDAARELARMIPLRHTNRRPYADLPVPHGVLEELRAAAAVERATLVTVDPPLREGILSLTRTADTGMRQDPRYRAELAEWTTPGGVGRRDGVPRESFGPRDAFGALPLREFAIGHGDPSSIVDFEPDPTIVLLYTTGDAPRDWLRAGAALQRILLTATLRGLAATPLSQVMEVPRLRSLLEDSLNGQVVQTVLRIGYPLHPTRPTPRRPVDELILPTD